MAKVISFNKNFVFVKPVNESNVVNHSAFDFGDGVAAVENAANRELVFKCRVIGLWMNDKKLFEFLFIRGKLVFT